MATIRLRDWTKERIEEIREAESHSSHDSVIKSLLKDRELAQFAGEPASDAAEELPAEPTEPADKAFEDLTVLSELESADNGLLFLWCPNCGKEIAHVGVENPLSVTVFEAECQRCLTRLDQHVIVAIEIGYPIERRLVDGTLEDDLQRCVVDYWDRALERVATGTHDEEMDDEQFVLKIDQYYREFGWGWPPDVPIVAFESGRTYRNDATGERFQVLDSAQGNANALNGFEIRRLDEEGGERGTDEVDTNTALNLVLNRSVYLAEETE